MQVWLMFGKCHIEIIQFQIHPFDETADELDKMTHDLIPKLDDFAVIVRQRNEKSE